MVGDLENKIDLSCEFKLNDIEVVSSLDDYNLQVLKKYFSSQRAKQELGNFPSEDCDYTDLCIGNSVYPAIRNSGNENINSFLKLNLELQLENDFSEFVEPKHTQMINDFYQTVQDEDVAGYLFFLSNSVYGRINEIRDIFTCHSDIEQFLINSDQDYCVKSFSKAQEIFMNTISTDKFSLKFESRSNTLN